MTSVRLHDPARDADWDRYAESHPGYTLYHGTAFRRAVAEAFDKQAHGFVATDHSGAIRGLLPLIRQKSPLFGDRLVSLPYANHGGPLADDSATAVELLQAAARHADALGCDQLEIRDHEPRAVDWPVRTDKVLLTRTLPANAAALGKELGSKLRSQSRRAVKEGAQVLHGGAELVPEFHAVFAENMRDLGTPVYPRRWFEILARRLEGRAHVIVVRLDGRPAAGAFLLRWKDTLEIPWAASARAFNRYSVNMLLYREALERAMVIGCRRFDFGRSTQDSGTHRFKLQWGAEAAPIHWRVRPRGGASSNGLDVDGEEGKLRVHGDPRLDAPSARRRKSPGPDRRTGAAMVKALVKSVLRGAAAALGPHRWRRGPCLLVLTYHRVLPEGHPERAREQPGMLVSPELLAMHLQVLAGHFSFVHLDDWLRAAADGNPPPGRSLALTFDDGWRDTYDHAFPILRQAGAPATVFLVTDLVGTSYSFWPNRLARMLSAWQPGDAQRLDERSRRRMEHLGIPLDLRPERRNPRRDRPDHRSLQGDERRRHACAAR